MFTDEYFNKEDNAKIFVKAIIGKILHKSII
jgi:hypothetical protein